MKKRDVATIAVIIGALLLILSYFFDDGSNDSVGSTMRDVADLVLTTQGNIDPATILTVITPTPKPPPTVAPGVSPSPTVANTNPTPAPTPAADFYQIYFTTPTCPPEEQRKGGIDELIAADLLRAQTQVDIAAFDLDAEPIVAALMALNERGVAVHIVTDTDNADLSSIRRLRRNGLSVVEDKRSGLMHNKFIIIDNRYLWTGAMNFTSNDVYCNNNNLVRFDAPALAANYRAEMDEMYNDRLFGPDSPDTTPQEQLFIQGVEVDNYFSPERELELINVIARTVTRAEQEILFMAFSFTNEEIGEAMLGRADAGVTVRGIFEKTGSDTASSYYGLMRNAGLTNVQVRLDGNSRLLHHKVIIVDQQIVIFGSFNFSASANRTNDENLLIVHDPTFAGYFVKEFEARWAEATTE
jgi:phosphatidylserine/phosphatidylglycerophosphate/cardiolipin synthase-like enzyme